MNPLYLRVKNWDKFQHYKSRDNAPSWIKMYPDLMLDYEFQKLSEPERYRLVGIWLLAGKLRNRIPFDAKFVAKSIDVKKVDLAKFVYTGWLELVDEENVPVSIESLETVYRTSSACIALAEQSRKAGEKGREADEHSVVPVFTLPALPSANQETEVDLILDMCGDVDAGSKKALLDLASRLPASAVAQIRSSTRDKRRKDGSVGVGYPRRALEKEIEERSAA